MKNAVAYGKLSRPKDAVPLLKGAMRELGFPKEASGFYLEQWKARKREGVALEARTGGRIVGVLVGARPEGGVGTIVWLVTSPAFRNRGIGAEMFRRACGWYREMGCHKLKLMAPVKKAVQFYEKQGMRIEGYHPRHWWDMDFWSLGKKI